MSLQNPMSLENRVDPAGKIVSDPARGLFTGNRGGRIHDPETRTLLPKRRWASKAWICCVTRFRGRRRPVMGPGYTHLFFLDEVTALSAGHRPCYECRRADAILFAEAWQRAFALEGRPRAGDMDARLHADRHAVTQTLKRWEIADLPDGAIISYDSEEDPALWVVHGDMLLRWSHAGYCKIAKRPATGAFITVTPPAMIAVLHQGFLPIWHPSAPLSG